MPQLHPTGQSLPSACLTHHPVHRLQLRSNKCLDVPSPLRCHRVCVPEHHGLPIVIGSVSLSIPGIRRHPVVTFVVIHPVVTICWSRLVVNLVIMGRHRHLHQPLNAAMPQLPQLKGALDPEASLLPCLGFRPVHVLIRAHIIEDVWSPARLQWPNDWLHASSFHGKAA